MPEKKYLYGASVIIVYVKLLNGRNADLVERVSWHYSRPR